MDFVIFSGLPWKRTEVFLSFLRLYPNTAFQTLLLTMMATPLLLRSNHEEIPRVQGKRNPSKTIGVVRGHQRADTVKP